MNQLMDLAILSSLMESPKRYFSQDGQLPRMYALSKTGSVRVYEILVLDKGDHAEMITRKKVTLNGKWAEDKYEYWEGVNIGKANETTYLEQAKFEALSAWKKLLDAGFTESMPNPDDKFNTDANGKIKPMLACPFDENKIKFPCLCQPKYDGVRCTISKGDDGAISIISRKGKEYDIPHLKKWAENHQSLLPLDGELYNHKELTFEQIVSAVKKKSDITSKIRYVVYDRPVEGVTNRLRWDKLYEDFYNIRNEAAYLSTSQTCFNMDNILDYHKKCVDAGYEGVIIRNLCGEYEFGFRSNNLIKLKDFMDAEFKIVDVLEATGRDAGTAIFICKCDGGEFRVKPQGSYEKRAEYLRKWKRLMGKYVTVKFQEYTKFGKPRFPTAVTIRDYE